MLKRKFTPIIESYLKNETKKILLVNGARQIGKSYLIRYMGQRLFKNFVEINLKQDKEGEKVFASVSTTTDLYMRLGNFFPGPLGDSSDTLIFLDEIQSYPHLLTMLKFLNQEGRFRFIASGSELGIALYKSHSVPLGSIAIEQMYPLDFEEFLWATGIEDEWIQQIKENIEHKTSLPESDHQLILKRFQYYLLVGGLPESVNTFLDSRNIVDIRKVQEDIHELYKIDASQYDEEHRLVIRKIYDLIPSNLENKKKRIVYNRIENKDWKKAADYEEEFEYLTNSGIALEVSAVSNPHFPLKESEQKRLVKLYLNDVGILTGILYRLNVNPILQDIRSINLGTVYESAVAQELAAHGFNLYYYDNKKKGEVDFLIDDFNGLGVIALEVKSGKDYTQHSALTKFTETPDYNITKALVLSNEREIVENKGITYMPIYAIMFFNNSLSTTEPNILPPLDLPELA